MTTPNDPPKPDAGKIPRRASTSFVVDGDPMSVRIVDDVEPAPESGPRVKEQP